jgi:hypothetical protein
VVESLKQKKPLVVGGHWGHLNHSPKVYWMDLISNLYNISFFYAYNISVSGILQCIVTKQEMYHIKKTEEYYKASLIM